MIQCENWGFKISNDIYLSKNISDVIKIVNIIDKKRMNYRTKLMEL